MRIWFDTEFYENGSTIELISIGLVREDMAELYFETPQAFYLSGQSEWLKENVRPQLMGWRGQERAEIAADIVDFCGHKPEFWAYYAAYDWVAMCQLFGTMIDLPEGWPMWCRDLQQEVSRLGLTDLPQQTRGEHNALADARWTREAWQWMRLRVAQ